MKENCCQYGRGASMSLCHNYFINNALTLSGLWFQFFTFQQFHKHKNADDYHRQKPDHMEPDL